MESRSLIPFEIDHIIPRKHRGGTVAGNLALACVYCNGFKGPNLSGIDPETKRITRLFHPRRHKWGYHFLWAGPVLVGRATIEVPRINDPDAVAHRRALLDEAGDPT